MSGDVSQIDACYSLVAHLTSIQPPRGFTMPPEADIRDIIKTLVDAAAAGELEVSAAVAGIGHLKTRLMTGIPHDELIAGD